MTEEYRTVAGYTIFLRKWHKPGRRKNIVLVHGLGVSSRYMVPLAKELAKTCNVYTIDLPGFGHSADVKKILNLAETAEVLYDYLKLLKLKNSILVGNSYGCQVIIECASRHPDKSIRIVLIGPTIDGTKRTWWRQVIGFVANLQYERSSQAKIVTKDYVECGNIRFVKTFFYALRDTPEIKLAQIKNPVLIIRGEKDLLVSQPWVEQLRGVLHNGDLQIIYGKGHALNYNSPRETAYLITHNPLL